MPAAATRSTAPAPKAPVEQKPLLPPAPPPPVVPVVAKSPAPTPPPAIQPATAPPAPTPVEDGLRASAVTTARAAEPPKPQPKKLDAVVPPVPPRVEPKAAAPVPPKPKTSAPVAPPAVSRPSVPAAVAPPPTPAAPIARVPLGRPERPSQEAVEKTPFNWKPVVLAAAAVLVLGFLGVGILTYTIISRRTPAVAKTEALPAPSSNQPTAAGGNTLHLRGELPAQAAFLVGSSKLPATKNGSDWDVDLAQQTPPFDLTVTAQGFDPAVVPIKSKSDIAQARTVSLTRSSGALSLARKTACDYTLVQMKMVEPLPEDSGFVQVDSTNREKNLTSDAGTPVSLPTGVYELVLRGADEHVIAPLQPMRVSVKAGSNQAIELPRTIAGKYVGQVKSTRPGVEDTAEREVSIDAKLVTGTVTEKRDSGPVSVPLSNGHLDGRGVYVARAAFASATGGARADEDVQIKRAQNDTVDANFEGTKADKTKYALSGTLRPGAMQVAAQAPAPAAAPNNADQQAKAKADEATRTASASKSESDRQKGESSTHSERSSSGSSTRSASQPAPRQPARSEAQPAKPTKRADTHEHAFQGTAPGG